MCEYLSKLTTSEVTAIITVLIALPSTWFLYKTFQSQKDSTEIAKETSIIDRRAKRAEYLPEITTQIDTIFPTEPDGFGSVNTKPYNGELTTCTVKIIFNKNPVQLIDWKHENGEKYIQMNFSPFPFEIDRILLPGNDFEIIYTINLRDKLQLTVEEISPSLETLENDDQVEPYSRLFFHNKLYFADMIGNKYELTFNINGIKDLTISDLKMID